MSTFLGLIHNIPGISIDRFDGNNLQSKCFFLSHCHTDHMHGLMKQNDLPGPLYLSSVSAVIVRSLYPNISHIIGLNTAEPTLVKLKNDNNQETRLTVTCIPASHCPGSVMFLFEVNGIKVLYTGDFRLQLKNIKRLSSLKDLDKQPIRLDALYVDSTFFDKTYMDFPTQFESNKVICDLIDEWTQKGAEYVAVIRTPARYGYEFLFQEIYRRTKLKIHINESEMDQYRFFPDLDNCFTSDPKTSCRIHASYSYHDSQSKILNCQPDKDPKFIRMIKPSAWIWTNEYESNKAVYKYNYGWYRVCYSNHSSFNEIRDLILYLKPKSVQFNVLPQSPTKRIDYSRNLRAIMASYQSDGSDCAASSDGESIGFRNVEFRPNVECRKSINLSRIAAEDRDIEPNIERTNLRKRRKL